MLGRWLRLLMLFELFAYLSCGALLVRFADKSPFAAFLGMLAAALAWRAWVIFATYLFAYTHHSKVPIECRIGAVQEVFEVLRELRAYAALNIFQAFERILLRPDAPARHHESQVPLLLIHGYCCNRGFWWWLKPRLEAAGRSVGSLTLEPVFGSIDGYAEQVARRVEALCRETGAAQVMLVGHSMGGLVCRAYLRRYGETRVSRLITLGTPHRGSVLARYGLGRNAREMEPGSSWLRAMAQEPVPVHCIAYYGTHDNYVMPQAGAMLNGAENRPLPGIGHLAMSSSPVVLHALLEATST